MAISNGIYLITLREIDPNRELNIIFPLLPLIIYITVPLISFLFNDYNDFKERRNKYDRGLKD